MKPFLRWAGSKRLLLRQLRAHWPGNAARYVEPFCGSACLFFDLQPPRAILGDLNEELICVFRAVKNAPELVLESFRRLRDGKSFYYKLRGTSPAALAEADRAARFLYLNRYCFNGIYRTNLKGQFNVPYSRSAKLRPLDGAALHSASRALSGVMIVNGDFEQTLSHAQRGDFVYLDPPYCTKKRRIFREYTPGSFALSDLRRLAGELRRLDALGATFVVSYADSAEARELLGPWRMQRVRVRRHIAGFSWHRRHAFELIATNRFLPAGEVFDGND
jgi:DNA adenine methylase